MFIIYLKKMGRDAVYLLFRQAFLSCASNIATKLIQLQSHQQFSTTVVGHTKSLLLMNVKPGCWDSSYTVYTRTIISKHIFSLVSGVSVYNKMTPNSTTWHILKFKTQKEYLWTWILYHCAGSSRCHGQCNKGIKCYNYKW